MGFKESHASPCLCRKAVNEKVETAVVVHVDDLLVATETKDLMEWVVTELGSGVKIKDLGQAKYYSVATSPVTGRPTS